MERGASPCSFSCSQGGDPTANLPIEKNKESEAQLPATLQNTVPKTVAEIPQDQ